MYIFTGIMHFVKPKAYLGIMPKFLPYPKALIFYSGIAEVILGIMLCFSPTKNIAVYGIIAMLAVFLIVHFNMLVDKNTTAGLPIWVLILRIPLQLGLMYWAYFYV